PVATLSDAVAEEDHATRHHRLGLELRDAARAKVGHGGERIVEPLIRRELGVDGARQRDERRGGDDASAAETHELSHESWERGGQSSAAWYICSVSASNAQAPIRVNQDS